MSVLEWLCANCIVRCWSSSNERRRNSRSYLKMHNNKHFNTFRHTHMHSHHVEVSIEERKKQPKFPYVEIRRVFYTQYCRIITTMSYALRAVNFHGNICMAADLYASNEATTKNNLERMDKIAHLNFSFIVWKSSSFLVSNANTAGFAIAKQAIHNVDIKSTQIQSDIFLAHLPNCTHSCTHIRARENVAKALKFTLNRKMSEETAECEWNIQNMNHSMA